MRDKLKKYAEYSPDLMLDNKESPIKYITNWALKMIEVIMSITKGRKTISGGPNLLHIQI